MTNTNDAGTLASAISELLANQTGPGQFIFALPKDVASDAAGLKKYTYRAKDYREQVSRYKFGVVLYYPNHDVVKWKLRFALCCFAEGGQSSDQFDAITLLNYCKPVDLINALKERVQAAELGLK